MDAGSGIKGPVPLEAVTAPAGGIIGLAHVTSGFDDTSIASLNNPGTLACANDGAVGRSLSSFAHCILISAGDPFGWADQTQSPPPHAPESSNKAWV